MLYKINLILMEKKCQKKKKFKLMKTNRRQMNCKKVKIVWKKLMGMYNKIRKIWIIVTVFL